MDENELVEGQNNEVIENDGVDNIKNALDSQDIEQNKPDEENVETVENKEDINFKEQYEALRAELEKEKSDKADIIKESIKRKEKLKEYEGIDPSVAKELLAKKQQAEAEVRKAEMEKAEKENNFESLKAQMLEAHNQEKEELKSKIFELEQAAVKEKEEKETLFFNNKFEESAFIKDNMILSPSKVRALYGEYFEVEGGKMVAYDAPRGNSSRTKIIDGNGNEINFDSAIEKILAKDPDKNTLIKSKVNQGAGSKVTSSSAKPVVLEPKLEGVSLIQEALNNSK